MRVEDIRHPRLRAMAHEATCKSPSLWLDIVVSVQDSSDDWQLASSLMHDATVLQRQAEQLFGEAQAIFRELKGQQEP